MLYSTVLERYVSSTTPCRASETGRQGRTRLRGTRNHITKAPRHSAKERPLRQLDSYFAHGALVGIMAEPPPGAGIDAPALAMFGLGMLA